VSSNPKTIVITGGLGYIGSNLIESLSTHFDKIVILDKATTMKYGALQPHVEIIKLNLAETESIGKMSVLFNELPSNTCIIHLAAEKSVEDSLKNPDFYVRENVVGTRNLLEAMEESQLHQIIFASTAAVYGDPTGTELLHEEHETSPLSPYAKTKLMCEELITSSQIINLHYAILRFFNVAGATRKEFVERDGVNLIPTLLAASRDSKEFKIYGGDYPTFDGTCVRDYVDVRDLVIAFHLCIEKLFTSNVGIINIGSGNGYSVLEVVEEMTKRIGNLTYSFGPRRAGDPSSVVADIHLAKTTLGWTPTYSIKDMIESVT
jgi:UDP-glucose 4-epimerase